MASQNPITLRDELRNNPFVWGNIALITSLPWLLALSMAGLAVGDPVFPASLEIFLLGFPAIALVTWIQWQQPFSPFSLWTIAKPPETLSDQERQVLTFVKQHNNGWYVTGWISIAVAIVMSTVFCKIYTTAPLAQVIAPFPAWLRFFGILWAEFFFLLSNILLQSGITALRVKLTAPTTLNGLQPFAIEKIENSFTNFGWRSPEILKFFKEDLHQDISKDLPQIDNLNEFQNTDSNSQEELEAEAVDSNSILVVNEQLESAKADNKDKEINPNKELERQEPFTETSVITEQITDNDSSIEMTEGFSSELDNENLVGDISINKSLDPQVSGESTKLEVEAIVEESEPAQFLEIADSISDSAFDEAVSEDCQTQVEDVVIDDKHSDDFLDKNIEIIEETILDTNAVFLKDSKTEEFLEITDTGSKSISEESIQNEINDSENDLKLNIDESIQSSTKGNYVDDSINDLIKESELALEIVEPSSELENNESANDEPSNNIIKKTELAETLDHTVEELEQKVLEPLIISNTDEMDKDNPEEIDVPNDDQKSETHLKSPQSIANNSISHLKKPFKKKQSRKQSGFGKAVRTNDNVTAMTNNESDSIARTEEAEISEVIDDGFESDVALLITNTMGESEDLEDDELDELIAFNVYVENILRDYLEDPVEPEQKVEKLDQIEEISESTSNIAKDFLITEQTLKQEDPEPIAPESVFLPQLEVIATENIETMASNLLEIETVKTDITNSLTDIDSSKEKQDPKYLVEELLLDQYLAKLQEINNANKTNKTSDEKAVNTETEIDEFADLEALIDRKSISKDRE